MAWRMRCGPPGTRAASTCGSSRRRISVCGSQWLDMTSYEHEQTFGLYFAILKKGEPTPLLPESDEDPGVQAGRGGAPGGGGGGAGRGGRGGGDATDDPAAAQPAPAAAPRNVTVQIDFEDLGHRILAVPGVPQRAYSRLKSGGPGTVFYLETPVGGGTTTLQRYRFSRSARGGVHDGCR